MDLFKKGYNCKRFTDGLKLKRVRMSELKEGSFLLLGQDEDVFVVKEKKLKFVELENGKEQKTIYRPKNEDSIFIFQPVGSMIVCPVCKVLINESCTHCPYCSWRF